MRATRWALTGRGQKNAPSDDDVRAEPFGSEFFQNCGRFYLSLEPYRKQNAPLQSSEVREWLQLVKGKDSYSPRTPSS